MTDVVFLVAPSGGEAARFCAAWQNHMLTRGDGYQWARDRAQTPPLREELGTLFHLAECGSQKQNYVFRYTGNTSPPSKTGHLSEGKKYAGM